jgi:S1-C subfamily serine protease
MTSSAHAPPARRPQTPAPRAARPSRAVALLALAALAGAAAVAAWALGSDSARPPAPPGIAALRVSSAHGIATGFAVADGRVVTVAHALDGPVTVGGRRVRVLRVDRRGDLALVSVPGAGAAELDVASVADGERLRIVRLRDGTPSVLSVHVRRSIVAHVRAPGAARPVVRPALELALPGRHGGVARGDSGAPVITDSGELAGIVFAASRNRAGTSYAVDGSALARLLERH